MKGKLHPYSCDTSDRYLIHIYLIITSIGFTYLIKLFTESLNREIPWWIGVPGIFGIYGVLYYMFTKYLWRCRIFRIIFVIRTPKIDGQYSGILKSSYDQFSSERNIRIKIWQEWDKMLIKLDTDSSESFSQSGSLCINDQSIPIINYCYINEPKVDSIKSMEIHYGMCILFMKGNELIGEFFTGRGRQTYGKIEAKKI